MTRLKNICIILVPLLVVFCPFFSFAQSIPKDFLITNDSIGFVKIGTPLKEIEKIAQSKGYSITKNKNFYTLLDETKSPLLTFTIFISHPQTKPVRTIKTTSSKFLLENGLKLIGNSVSSIASEYPEVSIFKVTPQKDSPELVDFKDWPFSKSIIKSGYIIKYETLLNKVSNVKGETIGVGEYPNDFCLYTNKYLPEAKIESFQIEAIEPNIKIKDQ